jgi:hypothetical protein
MLLRTISLEAMTASRTCTRTEMRKGFAELGTALGGTQVVKISFVEQICNALGQKVLSCSRTATRCDKPSPSWKARFDQVGKRFDATHELIIRQHHAEVMAELNKLQNKS